MTLMKNFLIGLLIGILACGFIFVVLVLAIARFAGSFSNRPVSVAEGSTLVLDLEGDVPERLPADIPIPILPESDTALGGTGLGHLPQGGGRFAH